jgi:hypothetical protein
VLQFPEIALKGKGRNENPLEHYFDFSFAPIAMPGEVYSGGRRIRLNLEATLFQR